VAIQYEHMEKKRFLIVRTSQNWPGYVKKSRDKDPEKPFELDADDYTLERQDFQMHGSTYEGWFIEMPKAKILDFKQYVKEKILIKYYGEVGRDEKTFVLEIYDDYRE